MIPTSINIPLDYNINDINNQHDFIITMKQVIEDIRTAGQLSEGNAGYVAPTYICDRDADTRVATEKSLDEDKIRFDVAGTEIARFESALLLMNSSYAIQFRDSGNKISSVAADQLSIEAVTSLNFNINAIEQLSLTDNVLFGVTDADVDLGKATNTYKNLFLSDTADASTGIIWQNDEPLLHTKGTRNLALGIDAASTSVLGGGVNVDNTIIGTDIFNTISTFMLETVAIGSAIGDTYTTVNQSTLMGCYIATDATGGVGGKDIDTSIMIGNYILYYPHSNGVTYSVIIGGHNFELSDGTPSEILRDVVVGYGALQNVLNNADIMDTVCIGAFAMALNYVSGGENTAVGSYAMYKLTTGIENVGVGFCVLNNITTGDYNNAIGSGALGYGAAITGDGNNALGREALSLITSAEYSIGIGDYAGDSLTTGGYVICIGAGSDVSAGNLTNAIAIGKSAYIDESNACVIGGRGSDGIKLKVTGDINLLSWEDEILFYEDDTLYYY